MMKRFTRPLIIVSVVSLAFVLAGYLAFNYMTHGKGVPWEALRIVHHYGFGQGETLVLESDYFPTSPVIQNELKEMRLNEERVVRFHQKEDWRLSFAINGFRLRKLGDGFSIEQHMAFDTTGEVYTWVPTPFGDIKVPDDIVHRFLDCTPFDLRYEYRVERAGS